MAPAKDERLFVAYARVSKLADGTELTNARQFRDLDAFATKERIRIVDRFEDRMSAWRSKKPRKDWQRMIEMVSQNTNLHILSVHTDRLTRNHPDLDSLQDLAEDRGSRGELLLWGPHQRYDLADPTTQMMIRFRTEMARQEAMAASRRGKDKVNDARLHGVMGGGKHSFGFRFVPSGKRSHKTGQKLLTWQVDPAQAAVVREVAQRYVDGETWTGISDDLNKRGILTARGNRWNSAHLTRMMGKPRLGGFIEWTDPDGVEHLIPMEAPEGHPVDEPWPILGEELFTDLQHAIRTAHRGPRNTSRTLLTNLPMCGRCGKARMVGTSSVRPLTPETVERFGLASSKRYMYRCPVNLGGCNMAVTACYVEDIVLSAVKTWVERNGHTLEGRPVGDKELERAQAELEAARTAYMEVSVKAIELGLGGARLAELKGKAEANVRRWADRVSELEDPARRREHLHAALDARWAEDPDQCRRVIEYVVTELVIDPPTRGHTWFDPNIVRLTLR